METRNLIIGAGEIGHCVSKIVDGLTFFHDPQKYLYEEHGLHPDPVMHICFPCVDQASFIKHVKGYMSDFFPEVVIIHSTVPVGTTDMLTEHGIDLDIPVIFSPVRGRHKTLPEHVRQFTKFFAPVPDIMRGYIQDIFPFVRCEFTEDAKSLEMAKIMCTTYLGWNVMFQKVLYEICNTRGLDFDLIYRRFGETYNDQCDGAVFPQSFARPIYDYMPGPIGGHCVLPNLELDENRITKILREVIDGTKFD